MNSHIHAAPPWSALTGAAGSLPGFPPGASPAANTAREVAGKAAYLLAAPFQTWYRVAMMRQSISQLGYCDDKLLRDIAGNRDRIGCIDLIACARQNRDPRRDDG